jgi:hypothetical protein
MTSVKQSAAEMAQAYLSDPWFSWTEPSVGLTWTQQGHSSKDTLGSFQHKFKVRWENHPEDLAQSLAKCEAYAQSQVESGQWLEYQIYITD